MVTPEVVMPLPAVASGPVRFCRVVASAAKLPFTSAAKAGASGQKVTSGEGNVCAHEACANERHPVPSPTTARPTATNESSLRLRRFSSMATARRTSWSRPVGSIPGVSRMPGM